MLVEMELSRILITDTSEEQFIELRELDGERRLPIVVGPYEAMAIERRLKNTKIPRPQAHELLSQAIESLGGRLTKIVINDLKEHTFFAQLVVEQAGIEVEIDSRPSDAIALGVGQGVPIFVAEHVLEEAGITP